MPRSNGCIPCKLRRKKCGEEKPSCAACTRNFLICAWGEIAGPTAKLSNTALPSQGRSKSKSTQLLPKSRPRQRSLYDTRPYTALCSLHQSQRIPSIKGLGQFHPQLNRAETAILYKFFLHRAAQVVCIHDEALNPFLHILVPVAMESDMVLHALLAFSGVVYLRNSPPGPVAHSVWEQYAQAVRSLKHSLTLYSQGRNDLAILLLITCLILCSLEAVNADTHEYAFFHLRAAQGLLNAAGTHCSNKSLFCFAAEFYLYIVALLPSCLSRKASVECRLGTDNRLEHCFRALMQSRTPLVGMLCGDAFMLFQYIPDVYDISNAIHDTLLQNGVAGVPIDLALSRLRVHSVIQSWRPDTENDEIGIRCGLIYQLALLSLLDMSPLEERRTAEDYPSFRRQLIADMILLLQSIPVESKHTTVLCWPLAVLGAYAEEAQHRIYIRSYLSRMVEIYKLGNMHQTLVLLDLIWKDKGYMKDGPRCLIRAMETQGFRIMLT